MRKETLFSITASLLLWPALVQAQPEQRPDQFFERGFVNGEALPEVDTAKGNASPQEMKNALPAAKPLGKPATGEGSWMVETESPETQPEPTVVPAEEAQGTAVLRLGAVLSRESAKHFEDNLTQLIALGEQRKVKLGPVWVVGSAKERPSRAFIELQAKLMSLGGVLRAGQKIPALYKIGKSPTWLFETKDGIVVIEGVLTPRRYLNSRGELIAPAEEQFIAELEAKGTK